MPRNPFSRRSHRRPSSKAEAPTPVHNYLQNLPAELINNIYDVLPIQGSLLLTLTCSRFYHGNFGAEGRKAIQASREARFEISCLLEVDGLVKGYHCYGCFKKHSKTAFSLQELRTAPLERYCLKSKKCLRISQDQLWSFNDVVELRDMPTVSGGQQGWPNQFACIAFVIGNPLNSNWLIASYPICESYEGKDFDECLRESCIYKIPACPHLCISTELLAGQIPQVDGSGTNFDPNVELPTVMKCDRCKTCMAVGKRRLFDGREYFCLFVRRDIGQLISPLEPDWIAQTFATEDPCLAEYWAAAEIEHMVTLRGAGRMTVIREPLDDYVSKQRAFYTTASLPKSLSMAMAKTAVQALVLVRKTGLTVGMRTRELVGHIFRISKGTPGVTVTLC